MPNFFEEEFLFYMKEKVTLDLMTSVSKFFHILRNGFAYALIYREFEKVFCRNKNLKYDKKTKTRIITAKNSTILAG
ncbi:hypothetical protein DFR80_1159 [Halanaerobium sp. ST460_2HS_T2]|nr:hypothetical protein DFR80_1159 [Halanaerobium sp. ST460_2HS_T2]